MKIKLIDKSSNLPNCWKECGASKEEWDKLQAGEEIDVKTVPDTIGGLVSVSGAKKKGDK